MIQVMIYKWRLVKRIKILLIKFLSPIESLSKIETSIRQNSPAKTLRSYSLKFGRHSLKSKSNHLHSALSHSS